MEIMYGICCIGNNINGNNDKKKLLELKKNGGNGHVAYI